MECIPVEGLEEICFGDWEGLSWKEVRDKYPKEYDEWYLNHRYTKSPSGESYQDMLERVLDAIHKIIATSNDNVVIVTHSAVIMCLQCYIADIPFTKMSRFKTENANIIEIESSMIHFNN